MSTDKTKPTKPGPATPETAPDKTPPAIPKTAPLFRPIDWFTLVVVTTVVMIGYWLTISPDLGLEDSGELAVGSFYAGIPHPPGYPVWTLYTYLWANFVPFHNIAWRVAMGSAFAGALSCGLIGFLVSRGSSLMIEGIEGLKNMDRRWENAICVVSGFVAGMLLGFDGFMWSQSVIVEVYSFEILSLMGVLVPLLRWIYAPKQRRYLYWAFFIFGLCFTTHQTLIVPAMGLVVTIAAVDYRLGRNMFMWCAIAFICGMVLWAQKMMFMDTNFMVFVIFIIVGLCLTAAYGAFAVITKISFPELCRDFCLLAFCALLVSIPTMGKFGGILACFALAGALKFAWDTRKLGLEWVAVLVCGVIWIGGAAFYLYMPLAGMSTPPMHWGYPRTVEGFMHALTRGQYEKTNPTDFFTLAGWGRFFSQLGLVGEGIVDEYNWVYSFLAIIPFLFYFRMQKREKAWMIGLSAIYICLSVLLVILLNPSLDRQARDLTKVFFIASHVMIVIWIGYGLTLIAATMLTRYQDFRRWGLIGGSIGVALALYSLAVTTQEMSVGLTGVSGFHAFFGAIQRAFQPGQYGLPIFAELLLLGLVLFYLATLLLGRSKPHVGLTLLIFAVMPLHSVMSHWSDNEQRGHLFGYWFGHDMFTPPFKDTDGTLSYDPKHRAELMKDPAKAKLIYPEMTRDAILYGGTDPGRFCPTYMIFCESFIPPSCKPLDPNFDRRDVYIITQNALADGTYLMYIRSHYNKSTQIQYDTPFFKEVFQHLVPEKERPYRLHPLSKLASNLLDRPFLALGNKIETRRRAEGVYPPKEMYIATPEDSQKCFQEYMQDAQRRLELGTLRPGEEVRPVRDASGATRVQVSGQVAVMAINGLLTKVMFDKNPTNEFFVEESFPLEWMYPHLTPFGVIMKINREKSFSLSEDVLRQDHEFWADYSGRLIGNWITYDTSVKEIVDFVEKTYLRRDFSSFHGDRKFVRDDQSQKAFSKLRSSIAGIYAWRLGMNGGLITDEQKLCLPKTQAEKDRLLKEADFAFKQAFAFCPYSPEAVFRYMQVLLNANRLDDAILVVETAQKLDPNNGQLGETLKKLKSFPKVAENLSKLQAAWKANPADFSAALTLASAYQSMGQSDQCVGVLDEIVRSPKVTADAILAVASYHVQARNAAKLEELQPRLSAILHDPAVRPEVVNALIQLYIQMQSLPRIEEGLERLVSLKGDSPEALYDLAAIKATIGKSPEAISWLKKSIELSDARLKKDPKSRDMRLEAAKDQRFQSLSQTPEFKQLAARP